MYRPTSLGNSSNSPLQNLAHNRPPRSVQGGAAYQSQGFKDEVFEVTVTKWLMLQLPTAQAGLRNSH